MTRRRHRQVASSSSIKIATRTSRHSRDLIGSVPRTVAIKVFCRSTDGRHDDQSLPASLGTISGTHTYEVFKTHRCSMGFITSTVLSEWRREAALSALGLIRSGGQVS